ncbi:MAG: Crp/Fnr family transcriptional regulator [Proteobacteria bacterium]|nr:Crp/Fnr family transcriptional regulator [Pseudomonadota bacterium]MCP4915490.1 Crp/Fnr family transcriptional regulator [Pseudomonadota bacterium]
MDDVRLVDLNRAFPSVKMLEGADARALLEMCTPVQMLENSLLFDEHDRPDAAYLVLEGRVRVERSLESGRRVPLGRLGRGHIVGDMGVLTREPRSASAVVEDDLVALRLDADTYDSLRAESHPIALWLLAEIERRMSERVASTYSRIARLKDDPSVADELPTETAVPTRWYERWLRWVRP